MKKKFWTFTGRYAFRDKASALRLMEVIENFAEDDHLGVIIAGSGFVIHQALRPTYHVIEFRKDGWTVQHPIDCDVFACKIPKAAGRLKAAPADLGHFHVTTHPDGSLNVGAKLHG